MSLRARVRRLEARMPRSGPAPSSSPTTLDRIRAVEADIRRLEAGMDPDEVRAAREADAAFMASLKPLETSKKVAAVERELERLELMGVASG